MADRLAAAAPRPAPRRGRPRKTPEERAEGARRRQLVRVAARLFRRRGFDATTTRDIAAAAGMRSGSPFYHFGNKGEMLFAVMEEGMRTALERQAEALRAAGLADLGARPPPAAARAALEVLIRSHFAVLLGPGSDFIPVMLYERRALAPAQHRAIAVLQSRYEAGWQPVLRALHAAGALRADPKLARLLIFGALNWSAQWFDRRQAASPEDLTQAALALFLQEDAT